MNGLTELPLYRVLLRAAGWTLLPLLALAAWWAYDDYRQDLRVERETLLQATDARVRLVERNLEQSLQVLGFGAARLAQPSAGPDDCARVPQELLRNDKGIVGAWVLAPDGKPLCGAADSAAPDVPPAHLPPLPGLGGAPWNVGLDGDAVVLRYRVGPANPGAGNSFVIRLDSEDLTGRDLDLLDGRFKLAVQWYERARPLLPRSTASFQDAGHPHLIGLRGQAVGELSATAVPGAAPLGSEALTRLTAMLGLTVGCLALLALALAVHGQRVIRRDVAKLARGALHPEEAASLADTIRLRELADVARAMAAGHERAAQLTDALRRNAERLEDVQRAAAIGSWRLDLRDGSVDWSNQTYALYGVPRHMPLTLDLLSTIVHPDDQPNFKRHTQALRDGGTEFDLVYRVVRPDRSERVHHARGMVASRDAEGRPDSAMGTVQDITEAFGAARLNEALSGALFLTGDAVLLARVTSQGEMVRMWANPAYDAMHHGLGTAHASTHEQLLHAERGLLRSQADAVQQALREQQPLRLEMALPLRLGPRWFELDVIPVVPAQGGEVHWLLVLRDIEARHEAEQRVRNSEKRYRELFNHHPLPMWIYDTGSLRIVDVNPAAVEKYGLRREEFLRRTVLQMHPSEDVDAVRDSLHAAPAEALQTRRWRHRLANGEIITVDIYGQDAPFDGPGHRLVCPVDRSAEQAAIEALRLLNAQLEATVEERTRELAQREQLYRVLSDLSPQILWQCDPAGQVTYLNRAWYELVGPSDDQWLGTSWLDVVHPDDVDAMREAFVQAFRSRSTMRVRRRLRASSGAYRSFLGVAAPVFDADGHIERWVGVDTDISELERQSSRLQQLNDELESFSYSISHDLRAPVQVMKGFLDAVLSGQGGQVDERARGYLERVLRNARRMDELIHDMLALSRLSRSPLRCTRFDVAALARNVVETIQERYPDRVVECWTPTQFDLVADRGLVQVALENLMDNAAKFSQGRPVCRLEFTARRERGQAVLELADEGVGFPPEYAHRLFRPFQRLHSQDAFAGTGVGLATVARIAHLHGGSIEGRNRPQGGALFELRLPLQPDPQLKESRSDTSEAVP